MSEELRSPSHFGQVYTWGFCTHGQLGLKEKILGAQEYVNVPTHIGGDGSVIADSEIKAAACGHFHTVVVDSHGNAFAFGRDDRGQLGHGGEDDEMTTEKRGAVPRRLKNLSHSIIVNVVCGAFHCIALTADGEMISWGWNKHGQLGRRTSYQCDAEPGRVEEAKGVQGAVLSLAAGYAHAGAVLAAGHVISWGSNEYGQLGVGPDVTHPETASTPVFVNGVVGRQVTAGDNHLVVLTTEGKVVAAGDASYGRLGHGEATEDARSFRFVEVQGLPWSEDDSAETVSSVFAGGATSAAISTTGRLFTWGGGVWGQLGHGDRKDSVFPSAVSGLPHVRFVDIAQDHMLAVCRDMQLESLEANPEDTRSQLSAPSSLWVWGRRRLLPRERSSSRGGGDAEAQWRPTRVPLETMGPVGAQAAEIAAPNASASSRSLRHLPELRAVCGGSHTVTFWAPPPGRERSRKRYTAAWCPRMSSASGPGTRGGRVSESLDFRIVSRNEEGKDEKVGGLRFRAWAVLADSVASPQAGRLLRTSSDMRSTNSSPARPRAESESDKSNFELQNLADCRDGTYTGVYTMQRPGEYLFHINMLPLDAEQRMQDDSNCAARGEPVSGSPFRVRIDSGPACACLCGLQVRSGGRLMNDEAGIMATSGEEHSVLAKAIFAVEASVEVVWDIVSKDVMGNPGTLKSDRFSATIEHDEGAERRRASGGSTGEPQDLATCMGLPEVTKGQSSVVDVLRERVRQREAEKLWARMSSRSCHNLNGSDTSSPATSSKTPLQVRLLRDPGRCEIRWTPAAVGSWKLSVALLCSGGVTLGGLPQSTETPIGGSPFVVQVIAGKPCPSNSKLVLPAMGTTAANAFVLKGDPPRADVALRMLLCDRMGNGCRHEVNPLQHVNVRIENMSIVGDSGDRPSKLLEWAVEHGRGDTLNFSLNALPALLEASAQLSAPSTKAGEPSWCTVCVFVSATDRASRQRIAGSPCRMYLTFDAAPYVRKLCLASVAVLVVAAADTGQDSQGSTCADSCQGHGSSASVSSIGPRPSVSSLEVPSKPDPALDLPSSSAAATLDRRLLSAATATTSPRSPALAAASAVVPAMAEDNLSTARSVVASVLGRAGRMAIRPGASDTGLAAPSSADRSAIVQRLQVNGLAELPSARCTSEGVGCLASPLHSHRAWSGASTSALHGVPNGQFQTASSTFTYLNTDAAVPDEDFASLPLFDDGRRQTPRSADNRRSIPSVGELVDGLETHAQGDALPVAKVPSVVLNKSGSHPVSEGSLGMGLNAGASSSGLPSARSSRSGTAAHASSAPPPLVSSPVVRQRPVLPDLKEQPESPQRQLQSQLPSLASASQQLTPTSERQRLTPGLALAGPVHLDRSMARFSSAALAAPERHAPPTAAAASGASADCSVSPMRRRRPPAVQPAGGGLLLREGDPVGVPSMWPRAST